MKYIVVNARASDIVTYFSVTQQRGEVNVWWCFVLLVLVFLTFLYFHRPRRSR